MAILKIALKVLLVFAAFGTASVLLGLSDSANQVSSVAALVVSVLVVRRELARRS